MRFRSGEPGEDERRKDTLPTPSREAIRGLTFPYVTALWSRPTGLFPASPPHRLRATDGNNSFSVIISTSERWKSRPSAGTSARDNGGHRFFSCAVTLTRQAVVSGLIIWRIPSNDVGTWEVDLASERSRARPTFLDSTAAFATPTLFVTLKSTFRDN